MRCDGICVVSVRGSHLLRVRAMAMQGFAQEQLRRMSENRRRGCNIFTAVVRRNGVAIEARLPEGDPIGAPGGCFRALFA